MKDELRKIEQSSIAAGKFTSSMISALLYAYVDIINAVSFDCADIIGSSLFCRQYFDAVEQMKKDSALSDDPISQCWALDVSVNNVKAPFWAIYVLFTLKSPEVDRIVSNVLLKKKKDGGV